MSGSSAFCLSVGQLMDIWLLPLSYYERCCHEHLCISFCVDVFFSPLEYIIRSTTAGSYNNSVQHFEELFFKVPIPTYQERERAPVLTQP